MGFIDNIKNDIEEASARYDIMTDKIMLFESVAYNNYIIKQKEAYLDAYKYGGDVEDYMTESEGGSFADKAKATIDKIIEALKEFFEKIKEKVTEIFQKVRESSLIQKVEQLLKINPQAANMKVEYEDNSKLLGFLHKESDDSKKRVARATSGKISKKDADDAEESKNRVAKYIAIGTGVVAVTVTLGFLLAHFKKDGKDIDVNADTKGLENIKKAIAKKRDEIANKKLDKKITKKVNKVNSLYGFDKEKELVDHNTVCEEEIDYFIKLGQTQSDLDKAFAKVKVTRLTNIINSMKVALSKIGNLGKKNTYDVYHTKDSDYNEVPILTVDGEKPTGESSYYTFDTDDYFSELCNDIFGDDTSIEDDFDTMYSELCNDIFF